MALALRGGHSHVLLYKHILVYFLVSNILAAQVKSATAALLTGTFNLCSLQI